LPVALHSLDVFHHQKEVHLTMIRQEAGLSNVWIRTLVDFHMGVQPRLGDRCDEKNVTNNPLGCMMPTTAGWAR
jgi:hypothetical protein